MAAVAHNTLNSGEKPNVWQRLNTGQKLSAVLHIGLILWVMLFDLFNRPEDPFIPEVTEVALLSAQDFDALMQPLTPPPAAAPQPEPTPEPRPEPRPEPAPAREPTPAPITPPAAITPPPPVETPPAPVPAPTPVPEPAPEPAPTPPAPAPEPPQAAVIAPTVTPDASLTPVQRPAERVAPEAAPTPDPQITIAPQDQAAVTPDATATVEAEEAQEATQREAAATETVTEATRISETEPAQRTATAPELSLRPRRRPALPEPIAAPPAAPAPEPTQAPTPEPTPAPEPEATASAIEDALLQALTSDLGVDPAPSLAASDIDALRLNIESCWNVGILSTEALGVVVEIGFEMTADARPVESSIRLVNAQGGGLAAQQAAFDAGRQAIVQCGINGYGLPPDLYDQWRFVEITFNPARMMTR
ncbi:hypothetical protein [Pararhodobacter oceanensis]|uniref:hypothetical protein n=1 Tax=Pararhodobacter oceanensis TaxID=2172121 RepID=UPI003A8E9C5B